MAMAIASWPVISRRATQPAATTQKVETDSNTEARTIADNMSKQSSGAELASASH